MKSKFVLLVLLAFSIPFAITEGESAYKPAKLLYKGWIKGQVTHTKQLEIPKLEINKDTHACGSEQRTIEAVDIGPNGGMRNAVVYIKQIATGKNFNLPSTPPTLSQDRCTFHPHVQVVPPMSTIKIINSDNILHSVHAFQFGLDSKFVLYPNSITYPANTLFNIAMVAQRKESFQQLGGPGIVKFICEAGHYWMTAYALVIPHPYYALVDAEGKFTIEDVPPGKYTLVSWHEYFGVQERQIQVRENQPVMANFVYSEEL